MYCVQVNNYSKPTNIFQSSTESLYILLNLKSISSFYIISIHDIDYNIHEDIHTPTRTYSIDSTYNQQSDVVVVIFVK